MCRRLSGEITSLGNMFVPDVPLYGHRSEQSGDEQMTSCRVHACVRAWPFVDPSQAKQMDRIFFPRWTESV